MKYYGGLIEREILMHPYQIEMQRMTGDLKAGITFISIEVWASSLESAVKYALALCNDFSKSTDPMWECLAAYRSKEE